MIALDYIESTIPEDIRAELSKTVRNSYEVEKSKYYKKENSKINLDSLVAFNYDLQTALQQYEMSDHLYVRNMVCAHYYTNINKSLLENDRVGHNDFTQYHDKEMIFRLNPGFGS